MPDVLTKIDLPRAGLLSNGRYDVLLLEDGTGYSTFDGYMLTPWRDDHAGAGTHLYVQDLESGEQWSAGYQPARFQPDRYEAWLAPGSFHFRRIDRQVEMSAEVCVAPDLNAELRSYKIINRSDKRRRLALTTYAEVALNERRRDAEHPAFSKLFVETEYVDEIGAVLARRRPKQADDDPPMMLQAFVLPADPPSAFETDRARFIGRGRTTSHPQALEEGLSGTSGSVLDPCLSLRVEISLEPRGEQEVVLVSTAGYSREELVQTVVSLRDKGVRTDAFLQSTLKEQQIRDDLEIGPKNADRYHRLAAGIFEWRPELGPSPALERREDVVGGAEARLGLDPSIPLVVGRVADETELSIARLLLKARDFWRALGLRTQLLILNDEVGDDVESLQRTLRLAIEESRGGSTDVVLRHADGIAPGDQVAVQAAAALWITSDRADLLRVGRDEPLDEHVPVHCPEAVSFRDASGEESIEFSGNLQFYNGYGGFSPKGNEYVVQLRQENGRLRLPPSPWVNVIANEAAGCVVSETGACFTWTGNSREHRLTPWYNDPVVDPHGEALYLRDDESGDVWCPLPGPLQSAEPVEVRHGFGYTRFLKRAHGIDHETVFFVPALDPLKVVRVRLRNRSGRRRRLSAAAYARWVMGESLAERRFVVTKYDEETGCILASNPHNQFMSGQPAFACLVVPGGFGGSYTSARGSFLGSLGDPAHPESLAGGRALDEHVGDDLDPCAAFLEHFVLAPDESAEFYFLLGQVREEHDLSRLIERHSSVADVQEALDNVTELWRDKTSLIRVETPVQEIDLMLNGWLLYQNVSCRLWARSAFYESGGAVGFRDQLQDVAALAAVRPELTREQILVHARHQFPAGDVLHWWHEPNGLGLRTRSSDDLLWLPYAVLHYGQITGDESIWDEHVPYVEGPDVPAGDDELLLDPLSSDLSESIYMHCRRAIDRALTSGPHGLPLIGSGDWNEGMNRIGRDGRGESVWLGFFLYDILRRFADVSRLRDDAEGEELYRKKAEELRKAVNDAGWDGGSYVRAVYDNGEPVGSSRSEEPRIDALTQSWAVISGAAPEDRARAALDALQSELIDKDAGIIRLVAPLFEKTAHDPESIRGFLPGVHENGGQDTQAALWGVMALAENGRCDRAADAFAMLSPVSHGRTPSEIETYQVEPYVVAGDVYGAPPHLGRGGWTWYTSSAGWMLRVGVESILGIRLVGGDAVEIRPCIPSSWPEFRAVLRHPIHGVTLNIHVLNGARGEGKIVEALIDDEPLKVENGAVRVPVGRSKGEREIEVVLA